MDLYAIVYVTCTDGIERIGITQEWDAERIVTFDNKLMTKLHEEYANAVIKTICDTLNVEMFDNTNPDYDCTFIY